MSEGCGSCLMSARSGISVVSDVTINSRDHAARHGGKTPRRYWLMPICALLSLALTIPQWTRTDWGYWHINYSFWSWFGFYVGICFLGLFAWESANAVRTKSILVLFSFCISLAIAAIVAIMLYPIRFDNSFFNIERLPFFMLFLVDIILIWNLVLMPSSHGKAPLRTNLIAAFSIVAIIWGWSFLTQFSILQVSSYGQMVSFFVLVIPTVLIWEGLLDSDRLERGIMNICAVALISGLSMFLAVLLGSAAWVT